MLVELFLCLIILNVLVFGRNFCSDSFRAS